MISEYVPANTGNPNTRYILGVQSPEEQKLLTVLRDLALRDDKSIVIVLDGAEWVDKKIPGMPANPVTRLSFHLEHRNGALFVPKAGQHVDPNQHFVGTTTGSLEKIKAAENVRVQEVAGTTTVEVK